MGPPLQHNGGPIATRRNGCFGKVLTVRQLRNGPKTRKFSARWLVGDQETILAPVRVIKEYMLCELARGLPRSDWDFLEKQIKTQNTNKNISTSTVAIM
jgi:hypothetical protein